MKKLWVGFAFFFGFFSLAVASAEAAVILKSVSEVDRAAIRLSDVFSGLPENADREIAIAPTPGKSVTYDVTVLNRLAQQYRVDWQPQTLSDKSVLTRASQKIAQEDIKRVVMEHIRAASNEPNSSQIDIAFDSRSQEIHLPTSQPKSFVLNNFDYDGTTKRFHADLVAGASQSPVVLPLSGRVVVRHEVPVLVKRLERGTVLGSSDLSTVLMVSEQVTPDMVLDMASLVGRELRRDIIEGQPLRTRDVMPQRFVTRGSLVTMKIETPYMRMTAQGKALQDGGIGDVVRLNNTQSNRMVEGIVTGPGTVRIPLPEAIVQASAGTGL